MVTKHFVTFCSPGTFVPETTTKEIDSWNISKAIEMAQDIQERHGATPYSFSFSTRSNDGSRLDSAEVARSRNYFLGGEVLTLEQVEERRDPEDIVLLSNMRNRGLKRVLVNRNSWKTTLPLHDDDVVLQFEPKRAPEEKP